VTALAAPTRRTARPMRAPWLRYALYALRRRSRAPLTWGLPLGLMAAMVVGVYPSIEDSSQLDELIKSYPDALKEAFGFTDTSLHTISGYLAGELFSMIAPFTAAAFMVHAIVTGISAAERRGVLDVLLSAPVRRRQLVAGHLAGAAVVLLGIVLVLGAVTQLAAVAFGVDLPVGHTVAGVLGLWPLGAFAGGVAVLLAGVWRRPAAVAGGAAGVLVAMYLVEVLGRLSDAFAAIDGVSAFHYYGSAIEDGLDPVSCAILIGAGVLLAAIGCALFERRDVG
jgi:beta-exotoxin I transport system permease protein